MTRLDAEIARLYGMQGLAQLASDDGRVRALVLSLPGKGALERLQRLWQVFDADLGWPTPPVAIDGRDAYQVWVSLEAPVAADDARALVDALFARAGNERPLARSPEASRLPEPSPRPRAGDPSEPPLDPPLDPPPRCVPGTEQWSAFVMPNLAAMFDEERWMALRPGDDAQADLLARLRSVPAASVARMLASTRLASPEAQPGGSGASNGMGSEAQEIGPPPSRRPESGQRLGVAAGASTDAQGAARMADGDGDAPTDEAAAQAIAFLRAVVADEAAPLRWRIEAAKAVLAAVKA